MFPSLATMEAMLTSAKFCPRLVPWFYACVALCFLNNVSLFIHPGSKNISLLSANLATQEKRNNVFAMMFPSLPGLYFSDLSIQSVFN